MSRGGGRGGRGGGRFGGSSSFIVQSYRNQMLGDGGPLGGLPSTLDDSSEQAAYPNLVRRPPPPTVVKDLKFMVAAKRDLESRFHERLQLPLPQRLAVATNSVAQHFPAELDWRRKSVAQRRRVTVGGQQPTVAAKRQRLLPGVLSRANAELDATDAPDAVEAGAVDGEARAAPTENPEDKQEDEEDEDEEAGEFENDEELEDNDYVDQYFDNGEGYGAEEGGEDGGDLDGESWYY